MRLRILLGTILLALLASAQAVPFVDAMRGPVPITATTQPPRLGNQVNDDHRLPRNYSYQPPVIPHRIDGELLRYAARFGLLAHKDDQIDEHDRYAIRAGFWREVDVTAAATPGSAQE